MGKNFKRQQGNTKAHRVANKGKSTGHQKPPKSNSSVNKKVKTVEKAESKVQIKAEKAKKMEKEIEEIEKENEIFDENGYYSVPKQDEVEGSEWGDDENHANINLDIFNQVNAITDSKIEPRVKEAYHIVGNILKTYSSGKLPKLFNILPVTENWEELIFLTNPLQWTPQAAYEATVLFCSNLSSTLAEKFYSLVLLQIIRNDIRKHKKLNIHLYNALKKAIFKPGGFFKGLIFPLAETANYKEASIIGSILKKCSIPIVHSSAALLKLTESSYRMGNLYFMKILLGKKYALPTPVKEGLVNYFYSFTEKNEVLSVLWHQTLLLFVQIYKLSLTDEEIEKMRKLISAHNHHLITDDINRELNFVKKDRMRLD